MTGAPSCEGSRPNRREPAPRKMKPRLVVADANAYWTEQLFAACGARHEVLLLKPREVRSHMARFHGSWRSPGVKNLADDVREFASAMPPRYSTVGWPIARRMLSSQIKSLIGPSPELLVICFPEYLSLADSIKPGQLVYYNYDDYTAHWPSRSDDIARREADTVRRADLTVCIARHRAEILRSQFPERANRIKHLPLGATPKFMADAVADAMVPEILKDLSRPMVGYIGALNYRFDFEFLAEVADARRNITFVLGGRPPSADDGPPHWWIGAQKCRALPNVHFIGWVDHERLGAHLKCFDALLIVYSDCKFNTNACPAKLWDYFGVGSPIVSTDANPETSLWGDLVRIASTPDQFADALDAALLEGSERSAERLSVAGRHTWAALAAQLEHWLEAPCSTPHDFRGRE